MTVTGEGQWLRPPSGSGSTLSVSDGVVTVSPVSSIVFDGANVTDGGSGEADVTIPVTSNAIPFFSMSLASHLVDVTPLFPTHVPIDFDQIEEDTAGICSGSGEITIDASTEGWWRLSAGVMFLDNSVATPDPVTLSIRIEYSDLSGGIATYQLIKMEDPNTFNIAASATCGRVIGLLAGDVVRVSVTSNYAGFSVNSNFAQTFFEGYFLRGY